MKTPISLFICLASVATPSGFAASNAEGTLVEWQEIITRTPLSELPSRMAKQNPSWPRLGWIPEHSEARQLAEKMRKKITDFEAEQECQGDLATSVLKTYGALAKQLQERKGYYNLLLSETVLRLFYCRVAHALIAYSTKRNAIIMEIEDISYPGFCVDSFAEMLLDEFAESSDLEAVKNLQKEQSDQALRRAVKWEGMAPRSIQAPSNIQTGGLIKSPLSDALLMRMMWTDWRLNMLIPALVTYIKEGGTPEETLLISNEELLERLGADNVVFRKRGTLRSAPISPRELKEFIREFSKDLDSIEEYQWAVK